MKKQTVLSLVIAASLLTVLASCQASTFNGKISFYDGTTLLGTLEGTSGTKIAEKEDLKTKLTGYETKTDFTFNGWHSKADFSDAVVPVNYIPYSDLVLYADFLKDVRITLSAGDGVFATGAKTVFEGVQGQEIPESFPTPSKDKAEFGGWFKADGTEYTSRYFPSDDLTLTAHYNAWPTLSFVTNVPGYEIASVQIKAGEKIPADLIDMSKLTKGTGFKFDAWYTDSAFKTQFNFESMPSASTTIYAKFLEKFTISFDTKVDGYTLPTIGRFEGETIAAPAEDADGITAPVLDRSKFVQAGKFFNGWYTDITDLTTKFQFLTMPANNVSLTALWSDDPVINIYKVFSDDATNKVFVKAFNTLIPGSQIDLSAEIPSLTASQHYSFEGFASAVDGTTGIPTTYLTNQKTYTVQEAGLDIYAYFILDYPLTIGFADPYGTALSLGASATTSIYAESGKNAASSTLVSSTAVSFLSSTAFTTESGAYKISRFVQGIDSTDTTTYLKTVQFPLDVSTARTIYAIVAKKVTVVFKVFNDTTSAIDTLATVTGYQGEEISEKAITVGIDGYYYVFGNKTIYKEADYLFNYAYDETDTSSPHVQYSLSTHWPKDNLSLVFRFIKK